MNANYRIAFTSHAGHNAMSFHGEEPQEIVPAHLDFLAIFNPELGCSEDTEKDQIVFYWSKPPKARKRPEQSATKDKESEHEQENERMRHVGLAQGMVSFARTFSGNANLDAIETEKHRIVLKQLEEGWWILASICLTRIPSYIANSHDEASAAEDLKFEYSSREVCPSVLIIEQLLRAQRIFLLHHGPTLSSLYKRMARSRFCGVLDKYWSKFARGWNIMLCDSPATDAYGAIKLAAAGELGVGVGEEEWGSGEREVLEGLVRNTEGLVELVAFRSSARRGRNAKKSDNGIARLSPGDGLAEGAIFTGVGFISRQSVRALTEWMRHVVLYRQRAYGVQENPASTRPKLQKISSSRATQTFIMSETSHEGKLRQTKSPSTSVYRATPAIPPSIMSVVEENEQATKASGPPQKSNEAAKDVDQQSSGKPSNDRGRSTSTSTNWSKYLTFGYRPTWSWTGEVNHNKNQGGGSEASNNVGIPNQVKKGSGEDLPGSEADKKSGRGRFLIGFTGLLGEDRKPEDGEEQLDSSENDLDNRLSVRTIQVEVYQHDKTAGLGDKNSSDRSVSSKELQDSEEPSQFKPTRLRIILYEDPPFLYALLFEPSTYSLSAPSFYYSLHSHLAPLRKPLEESTSTARVQQRLTSILPTHGDGLPVYDLVFDPTNLTVRSSIPDIPIFQNDLVEVPMTPRQWTRLEALNVHSQILATITDSRTSTVARESSVKSHRGWWINWMRIPSLQTSTFNFSTQLADNLEHYEQKEVVLVRKANDVVAPSKGHKKSSSFGRLSLSGSAHAVGLGKFVRNEGGDEHASSDDAEASTSWNTPRFVEGIGMDPRKYIDSLFSLNR